MRRIALALLLLGLGVPATAPAQDRAGEFDYYLLALSWNAAWCAAEGDSRNAAQCEPQHELGFVLHGLWPQYEGGWPEYCATSERDPSRAETEAMDGLTHSPGLSWYEWKKHGRCAGLDPADYFALVRRAWDSVTRPEVLRRVQSPLRMRPDVVERAFLEANPGLSPESVTVTCKAGVIREVRICLARDLTPRPCSGPAARGCPLASPLFLPMR